MLATAIATGAIVGFGAVRLIRQAVVDRYVERYKSELRLVSASLPRDAASAELEREIDRWGALVGTRLTLIGTDGRVVADSILPGEPAAEPDSLADSPEVVAAQGGRWGLADRTAPATGVRYLFLVRRLDPDAPARYLRVAIPYADILHARQQYYWPAALLLLVGIAVPALAAYMAVRRWTAPVERLRDATRRLASGRFDEPVPGAGDDELGRLSSTIERARQEVLRQMGKLQRRHEELQLVVASMNEGVLLVNPDRHVRLVNPAFRSVLPRRMEAEGRPLTEVVRDPRVIEAVDEVLATGADCRQRIRHLGQTGRSFELVVTAAPAVGTERRWAAVALFFDVTRIEALEETRREFVANVTHELRTPLTSIKACAHTLQEGAADDPAARDRFLGTIVRQSERMAALVSDLTDLSRMETGAIQLDMREFDAGSLVPDVIAQVSPKYEALDLSIGVDLPMPFTLRADRRRFEQVLVNLVDNAMKFNRPGGAVTVRGYTDELGRRALVVEDTGEGIALEAREKVFQRFFRVDPTRSRELGGTGLGLSIVKHLVQLHGGEIRLESELGQGSRFTVLLPPPAASAAEPQAAERG
jgi:two-component system phosphate regulon sensor histidine kinase PhoR